MCREHQDWLDRRALHLFQDDSADKTLSPAEVATVLQNEANIRKWLDSVRDTATAAAIAGNVEYPGMRIYNIRGRRRWRPEAAEMLFQLLGARAWRVDTKPITLAQAKKFGVTEAQLAAMTEAPESKRLDVDDR